MTADFGLVHQFHERGRHHILAAQFRQQASTLSQLTGWSRQEIEQCMERSGQSMRGR